MLQKLPKLKSLRRSAIAKNLFSVFLVAAGASLFIMISMLTVHLVSEWAATKWHQQHNLKSKRPH